jgi:hypothetical protein
MSSTVRRNKVTLTSPISQPLSAAPTQHICWCQVGLISESSKWCSGCTLDYGNENFPSSTVHGLKYVQTLAASNHYLVPMIKELGGSFSQQRFFALLLQSVVRYRPCCFSGSIFVEVACARKFDALVTPF